MIYNCRICGNDADWEQGHGCALATPENERHRLTLKERDEAREHIAESKAREEALEKELQQVCIDCGRLEFERDRLKGELAEARRWWRGCENLGGPPSFVRSFLGNAPSPAESPLRTCDFCGCRTNAQARACCTDGRAADA